MSIQVKSPLCFRYGQLSTYDANVSSIYGSFYLNCFVNSTLLRLGIPHVS